MYITLPAFKAAAKRLASVQSTSVSASQEHLSQAFGFANFDSALKRLAAGDGASSPGTADREQRELLTTESHEQHWCGMPRSQFNLVLYCLKPADRADGWAPRGMSMLNAVISNLQHVTRGDVSASDLFEATTLAGIERAYMAAAEAHGPHFSTWPIGQRSLGRYLSGGLPGYKVDKLLAKHNYTPAVSITDFWQDESVLEDHASITAKLMPTLDLLQKTRGAIFESSRADVETLFQHGEELLRAVDNENNLQIKARKLWRALVQVLCHFRDTESVGLSIAAIVDQTSIASIERLYIKGFEQSVSKGHWAYEFSGIKSYLESDLRGYSVDKLLAQHGHRAPRLAPHAGGKAFEQDSNAQEQHDWRVLVISPFLDTCELIESKGGPDEMSTGPSSAPLGNYLSRQLQEEMSETSLQKTRNMIFYATEGDRFQGANRHHHRITAQ